MFWQSILVRGFSYHRGEWTILLVQLTWWDWKSFCKNILTNWHRTVANMGIWMPELLLCAEIAGQSLMTKTTCCTDMKRAKRLSKPWSCFMCGPRRFGLIYVWAMPAERQRFYWTSRFRSDCSSSSYCLAAIQMYWLIYKGSSDIFHPRHSHSPQITHILVTILLVAVQKEGITKLDCLYFNFASWSSLRKSGQVKHFDPFPAPWERAFLDNRPNMRFSMVIIFVAIKYIPLTATVPPVAGLGPEPTPLESRPLGRLGDVGQLISALETLLTLETNNNIRSLVINVATLLT